MSLALSQWAAAAPEAIYQPPGTLMQAPVVDAIAFYNTGDFDLTTVSNGLNINQVSLAVVEDALPFSTKDTLYFTNASSGDMLSVPGFRFDTVTSKTRYDAERVVNNGTIQGEDIAAFPATFSTTSGTTALPAESRPVASQLLIYATNVFNNGFLGVGDYGLLHISAKYFTNNFGSLSTGAVDTADISASSENFDVTNFIGETLFASSPEDTTGRGASVPGFYVNPAYVYDLGSTVTNGQNLRVDGLAGELGGGGLFYENQYNFFQTNIYYDLVFVATNGLDTNIFVNTEFTGFDVPTKLLGDINADGVAVQFGLTTTDVITGNLVTNAIYLLDSGAVVTNVVNYYNASSADDEERPEIFEITTVTPAEFTLGAGVPATNFDGTIIYSQNPGVAGFEAYQVPNDVGIYEAQIGRNPETADGSFNGVGALLPDPTNEAARIEINAGQADLTATRLRSEGMVIFNITNLINGGATASDYGIASLTAGATNGTLVVSNFVPTNFQRVRGLIEATSYTFQNVFTNASVTNTIHYHVLSIYPQLRGNFTPTLRNLTLTGSSSIAVNDKLSVLNGYTLHTTNLTVNGALNFTGSAGNFYGTNAPQLKNIFVNTNATLSFAGTFDLGYNTSVGPVPLSKRKYEIESLTNFGSITAAASDFQVATFENDGTYLADDSGSIVIDANQIGFGLALTNAPNSLEADGNITLSAPVVEATNSTLYSGLTSSGTLTFDVAQTLTDFVPGTPSTNDVLHNFWTVTGGFVMMNKPTTGDLFGTEIQSIAAGFSRATHVWAGTDMGSNASGFSDNVVIGHLKLSRQSAGAQFYFTGATAKNGLYVDYLEFDLSGGSLFSNDYRAGVVIDPSLTIYFADSNVDPIKLQDAYSNRLVWVPSFAGPNSTVAVPYENSTNVCLLNAALATSPDISFFNGIPNAYNQPYVLNNPSNPSDTYPCPSDETADSLMVLFHAGQSTNRELLNISPGLGGRLSPNQLKTKPVVGNNYTFTAIPSNGWSFSGWTVMGINVSNTNSERLSFQLPNSNVVAIANFTANPFTLQKGLYSGLFFQTNAVTPDSSGYFSAQVQGNGAFSGQLVMGPAKYPFSSRFPTNGGVEQLSVRRPGKSSLTLDLSLDTTNTPSSVQGTVSDGVWTAPLYGEHAASAERSAYAGKYTMVLPWDTSTLATNLAGGDSYGVIQVTKAGVLSIGGQLADGTSFSQTTPISDDGRWPFYTYAGPGEDIVLGWVQFTNGAPSGTNTSWSKGPGTRLYPAGFTNTLDLIGSTNSRSFSIASPVLYLDGGNLAGSTNALVAGKNSTYATTNTGRTKIVLTVNAAAGTFSGHFFDTNTGRTEAFRGGVLDNQNSARGFFLGTNEAGAVLLQPASGGE